MPDRSNIDESGPSRVGPLAPMEAKLVSELPQDDGWQFEPKWDGFRAIVRREGDDIEIFSKSGNPLGRYFPEVVGILQGLKASRFLIDGELILPIQGILSFDALQARLHPAASRIAKLSHETPAQLMLFDLLALGPKSLIERSLAERRNALDRFHGVHGGPSLLLSPSTLDRARAVAWLGRSGGALDGVVAKRLDEPYRPGERAMLKVKQRRTADCVVGGFRYEADSGKVASLLLGLYNGHGLLDHVGFVSGLNQAQKQTLAATLAPLEGGEGFTGKTPGGPSRWNSGKETEWVRLEPRLVVEILYDQVTGERFRHGARFLRWRPDKAPRQCTMEQLELPSAPSQLNIDYS